MALEVEGAVISIAPRDSQESLHGMGGVGVVFTPWIPEHAPTIRPIELSTTVLIGNLGDDRHGPLLLQNGLRQRFGFDEGVMNFFFEPRGAFTISAIRDTDVVGMTADAGAGVGLRLLDLVSATVWSAASFAVNDDFHNRHVDPSLGSTASPSTSVVPRLGLDIAIDVCFFSGLAKEQGDWCRYRAPHTESVDLTVVMESAIADIAGHLSHENVCDAVRAAAAVDADADDAVACQESDAKCFLSRLRKHAPPGAATSIDRALEVHKSLLGCETKNRLEARVAAAHGWSQRRRIQYAAYPSEMVRALGCEQHFVGDTPEVVTPRNKTAGLELACDTCPEACVGQPWYSPNP